ncbi:type III polyketide synthase [Alteraurantiacibacter palmitatis]|uniref:Type III polyketide synthase n=1 Tax=Alteraurantiacibacter palmitatis TaxID=2054628 RepID=A0ABV7E7Z8_9SPHN
MAASRPIPRIAALATALPSGPIEGHYRLWAEAQITDPHQRDLFRRMADRAGITQRHSVLDGAEGRPDAGQFYDRPPFPSTAARMALFAQTAPGLALQAIHGLPELGAITHLVLACCTGFMAPGLDQVIARRLGLAADVERISLGFMGCYAGVTALRSAGHIVRSLPQARVLVVTVELCTLHLQQTGDLEALLAMRQFADGAAAALVTAEGPGLALGDGLSRVLDDSGELITWTIGDTGFAMHLSGAVPARLAAALEQRDIVASISNGAPPSAVAAWAVHPGGRSILDAVERGLGLQGGILDASRGVLADCGNMSSATVMFVLQRLWDARPPSGMALAFGPGLALEGLRFGWIDGDAG